MDNSARTRKNARVARQLAVVMAKASTPHGRNASGCGYSQAVTQTLSATSSQEQAVRVVAIHGLYFRSSSLSTGTPAEDGRKIKFLVASWSLSKMRKGARPLHYGSNFLMSSATRF